MSFTGLICQSCGCLAAVCLLSHHRYICHLLRVQQNIWVIFLSNTVESCFFCFFFTDTSFSEGQYIPAKCDLKHLPQCCVQAHVVLVVYMQIMMCSVSLLDLDTRHPITLLYPIVYYSSSMLAKSTWIGNILDSSTHLVYIIMSCLAQIEFCGSFGSEKLQSEKCSEFPPEFNLISCPLRGVCVVICHMERLLLQSQWLTLMCDVITSYSVEAGARHCSVPVLYSVWLLAFGLRGVV